MSPWRDFQDEMQRLPLDEGTADRLLAGAVAPEDAPPGYAQLAVLLAANSDRSAREELPHETETVERMAAVVRSSQPETTMRPRRSPVPRLKLAAALATAALAGTTGLALAGSLPDAAQDIASSMLAKAGVSVPGPNGAAGEHPSVRGTSPEHVPVSPAGTGSEISELATTTDLVGVDKGAAISALASDGQSRAGENGEAGAAHGAPVETPSVGGAGAADTASGGESSEGTSVADEASAGRSGAGAGNAAAAEAPRP